MEDRKLLALLIFFLLFQPAFAYEKPTHTDLTSKTFDFFNQKFPDKKILEEYREDLIAGAVEEDEPPRWFFHFYDPIKNRGLTLKTASFVNAKQWAQDKVGQSRLARNFLAPFFGNQEPKVYTYGQAIKAYKKGDKEKAFRILGHTLHLLQDMTVPEHVRNEYHPQGSPYEKFALSKRSEIEDWRQPVVLENLDDYFDELATYTNRNFYSPNTIDKNTKSSTGLDSEFGVYKLFMQDNGLEWLEKTKIVDHPKVLSDYHRILSRKSIMYGAGLIDLFFRQIEKELIDEAIGPSASSGQAQVAAALGDEDEDSAGLKKRAVIPLDKEREKKKILPLPVKAEPAVKPGPAAKACAFNIIGGSTRFPVIISEVAWMGSLNSANDEWIELRNISSSAVDISGWSLVDKDEDIKIVLSGTLPASNFYLLERSNDDSVPVEKADLIYTGALANKNDGLRLFNKQCQLVDEVLAAQEWPAGNSTGRRTMERGTDLSWHTYSGGENNRLYGTPKKENSQPSSLVVSESGQTGSSGSGGSGGSGYSAPASPGASSAPGEQNLNIKIHEYLFDPPGSDEDKEFIKLYNQGSQGTNLENWSIQVRSPSGNLSKKNFENGHSIAAGGYFLIWLGEPPSGIQAQMLWRSGSLPNDSGTIYLVRDQEFVSSDSDPEIVDKVSYTGQSPAQNSNPPSSIISASSSTNYIEIAFSQYPFIDGDPNFWKLVVFYLNRDPETVQSLSTETNWAPASGSSLSISYPIYYGEGPPRGSLILPDVASRVFDGSSLGYVAYNHNSIDFVNKKLRVKVSGSFTSSDYVTAAYYNFAGGGGGSQTFELKLADVTRYYFRE